MDNFLVTLLNLRFLPNQPILFGIEMHFLKAAEGQHIEGVPMFRLTLYISMLICLGACSEGSDSQLQNVFGVDNRQPITSTAYPWTTIGKVFGHQGHCTGTLVGKKLVLTAAHCIMDPATKKLTRRVI